MESPLRFSPFSTDPDPDRLSSRTANPEKTAAHPHAAAAVRAHHVALRSGRYVAQREQLAPHRPQLFEAFPAALADGGQSFGHKPISARPGLYGRPPVPVRPGVDPGLCRKTGADFSIVLPNMMRAAPTLHHPDQHRRDPEGCMSRARSNRLPRPRRTAGAGSARSSEFQRRKSVRRGQRRCSRNAVTGGWRRPHSA